MMHPLAPLGTEKGLELLCIGAHSDDLEIGCSGTVMGLVRSGTLRAVTWVVLSGADHRAVEARAGARRVLGRQPDVTVVQQTFRDGFFPHDPVPIKEFFEDLKRSVRPDLILTHFRGDLHQDHRLVSEFTYNTFRNHLIFEYEIFKIDGDLGQPNVYVPLDPAIARRKIQLLMSTFSTQRDKRWFNEEAFRALMYIRGVESGAPSGMAEAFYGRKIVVGWGRRPRGARDDV